jgi:hypothetical protein
MGGLSAAMLVFACVSAPPEDPQAARARLLEAATASQRGECASALGPALELSESRALSLEDRQLALAVAFDCARG